MATLNVFVSDCYSPFHNDSYIFYSDTAYASRDQ